MANYKEALQRGLVEQDLCEVMEAAAARQTASLMARAVERDRAMRLRAEAREADQNLEEQQTVHAGEVRGDRISRSKVLRGGVYGLKNGETVFIEY